MKHLSKFFMLGVIIALLVALVVPISAQDDIVEPAGPGEGGVIIEANTGGDASTFNPILASDSVSLDITAYLYPDITAIDETTLASTPGAASGLAESWEYDESGTVLTIHIRQDMFWSDGTQITADDWIWAVNAVKSGQTSSPRTSSLYQLDDGTISGGPIHEVTKIDDFTVEVRLGIAETDEDGETVLNEDGTISLLAACDALEELNDIAVVPAHVYDATFGDDYAAMDADPYFYPATDNGPATFGVFTDPFIEFGVGVSLIADQNYTDTTALDYVAPGEWFYQNIADRNVEYERFLAGDFTYTAVAANRQNEFRALADETGDFQYLEYPSNGYTYMAFNMADPTNPQSGSDENGELIDQGIHPIFGDVNVRQAIAIAINVEEMIGTGPDGDNPATGILEGNGYPIATHDHPVFSTTADALAENGVVPRAFDPELAMQMLDDAGWSDSDGDGVRECNGCLYATSVDASYEGTLMEFSLITNSGNTIREAAGETIRAQLLEVGMVVNFQAIDFGSLVDELLNQTYDALMIGWGLGLPWQPSGTMRAFFAVSNDIPGSGFNHNSVHLPEFDVLLDQADSFPGCDPAGRDALYAQAQQMLYDEQVYVFLFFGNVMFAAQGNVENLDALPYATTYNIDDWVITDN